jgi:outer membrane protein
MQTKKLPMKYKWIKKALFTLTLTFILMQGSVVLAQTDTLQLKEAIDRMLSQYPTIKIATEALNAADTKIRMARAGYLPNIDATGSYTRIGPVPSFDFPGFGHISLYPENNIAAAVNIDQNIYDFGKTAKKVAVEEQGKVMTEENIDVVKNQLTQRLIYVYYSLLASQEAVKIKDQQIENLKQHLSWIEKKRETGSSTDYEVLSTQVRLTATESQKTDLETTTRVLLALLNSFLGQPESTPLVLADITDVPMQAEPQDSSIAHALNERAEIKLAADNIKMMQMNIDLTRRFYYPSIRAFASGGGKNGYVPDINKFQANYTAGIGVRIPIFDAARTKNTIALGESALMSSQYQKDQVTLEIRNEVINYYQKVVSAITRVDQTQSQVNQAEKAYNLANTSYQAGVITNLDLLDATTALSESRLALLRSKVDLVISYYELQIAEGRNSF